MHADTVTVNHFDKHPIPANLRVSDLKVCIDESNKEAIETE
jgi:hypothetical protein